MPLTLDPFKERVCKTPPKKAVILSQPQLNHLIHNSTFVQNEKNADRIRHEENKQRQAATKALSKLVMQRKDPMTEFRKRQYAYDIKMAQLDLQRDSRIEARRNVVLDMAYKKLYEETDRVKFFKSAKNLAEMLHDRDVQVEAKRKMGDKRAQFGNEYVLGMMRDVDNYHAENIEKLKQAIRDKKKNAENWTKQMDVEQKQKRQEDWEHLRDGFIVREDATAYTEEVEKAKIEQKRKDYEYKLTLDEQKNDKIALLDMYAKLDEADEKRAEIFNEAKRDMKMKYKKLKEEANKEKEIKREYVMKNLRKQSSDYKIKEEANIEKAYHQEDAKTREACLLKEAKRQDALKAIQEYHEQAVEEKIQGEMDERLQGHQERRRINERVEQLKREEDAKIEKRKQAAKETQHTLLHQISKRRMEKQAKVETMNEFMNHIRSLDDEEEIFQKYAQVEINDCEARGIDTTTMRWAARPGIECGKGPLFEYRGHIRPRLLAAQSTGDELSHTKRVQKLPDSKSRLGFMLH